MVLIHHYAYYLEADYYELMSGLHFFHNGVDLFFVLTGFLFAPMLLGERVIGLKSFFYRRFFRLYPVYFLSLIVGFSLAYGTIDDYSGSVIAHLSFTQAANWRTLAAAGEINLIYWTLSVEVSFYLLVALMLFRMIRGHRKPPSDIFILVSGLVSLLLYLSCYYLQYSPKDGNWVLLQAQLVALLPAFWFGTFVYGKRALFRGRSVYLLGGSLLVLGGLYLSYPYFSEPALTPRPFGWFNVLSAFGYALLLAAVVGSEATANPRQQWWVRLCMLCGGISYSVYLFHDYVIKIIGNVDGITAMSQVVISTALTVVISLIIWTYIEMPLRAFGRKLAA